MMKVFLLLSLCLFYVNAVSQQVHAVESFTADFTVQMQYNASFQEDDIPGYFPIPFLTSPVIMPVRGKIWFNYPTAELRIQLSNGDGAPWNLQTTIIANSYNFFRNQWVFNCTTDIYFTSGTNKCWYGNVEQINLPNEMGGTLNLTYNGTKVVDGQNCLVFVSNGGTYFAIRLTDLAVVQIDLPYVFGELAPFFNFLGFGSAVTTINIFNIVIGAPDPSNFEPPTGECLKVYNDTWYDHAKDSRPFENFFHNPVAGAINKLAKKAFNPILQAEELQNRQQQILTMSNKKRDVSQAYPPRLNQTFSADWVLNASIVYAPYTPYTLYGKLGFDLTTFGLYWTLDGSTGNVPVDLQLEFRIFPNRDGIEFLQLGNDNCYSYLFIQWIFTYLVPVFEVPYDSGFQGTAKVNGDSCTVWQTTWNWYDNFAELYVRDSDHIIVQSIIPDPFSSAPNPLILTNINGNVPPASYSRPQNCAETMTWSQSFASHLPWAWCYPYC